MEKHIKRKSLLFFSLALALSGCSLLAPGLSYDDHETCDRLMTNLTQLLTKKDKAGLTKLFAPRLKKNIATFDTDMDSLMNYYIGDFGDLVGRVDTSDYSNYDYAEKYMYMQYTVITSLDTYRFSLLYTTKDSRSEDNIGIHFLYVLKKSEDPYPNDVYVGSLTSESDVIFVAYPHELPKDASDSTSSTESAS
jgi:hypothetical protein